jgi:two-component system chemotaxis response regulator CheY
VLVVDDSALSRFCLRRFLNKWGFTNIIEVEEGYQALQYLAMQDAVDLVVVDWIMPGMSGLDLVSIIRSDRKLDSVKILVMSAENRPSQIESALAQGADEYLVKPFSNDAIYEKLVALGLCAAIAP